VRNLKIWTEEEIEQKAIESLYICPKCSGPLSDIVLVRKNEEERITLGFHFSSFCPICGILRTAVEYLPKFCENCASQVFGVKITDPEDEFCWFCGGKMKNLSQKEIKKISTAIAVTKRLERKMIQNLQILAEKRTLCIDGKDHIFFLEKATLLSPPFFTLICEKCKKIFIAYSDTFEG
jgi:rubrerythrin